MQTLELKKIANEVGMSAFKAELLPMDKLMEATKLQQEGRLLYVGDGVNDAPVMAQADCAVSMGKLGSAAAIEVSDVVLISDSLSALPIVLKIARRTRAVVMQKLKYFFFYDHSNEGWIYGIGYHRVVTLMARCFC